MRLKRRRLANQTADDEDTGPTVIQMRDERESEAQRLEGKGAEMMSRAAMLSEDEAQEQGDEAMVLFRRAAILRGDATSEVYLFRTLCCSISDERIMYNLLCLLPPNLRRNRVAPSYVYLTLDALMTGMLNSVGPFQARAFHWVKKRLILCPLAG